VGDGIRIQMGFCSEFTSKNMLGQVQKKGGGLREISPVC